MNCTGEWRRLHNEELNDFTGEWKRLHNQEVMICTGQWSRVHNEELNDLYWGMEETA